MRRELGATSTPCGAPRDRHDVVSIRVSPSEAGALRDTAQIQHHNNKDRMAET